LSTHADIPIHDDAFLPSGIDRIVDGLLLTRGF
jgi:hypothetical protein